jgi:hypothetical protein
MRVSSTDVTCLSRIRAARCVAGQKATSLSEDGRFTVGALGSRRPPVGIGIASPGGRGSKCRGRGEAFVSPSLSMRVTLAARLESDSATSRHASSDQSWPASRAASRIVPGSMTAVPGAICASRIFGNAAPPRPVAAQ